MNRDDIIRMAEEAGMTPITHASTADVICSRDSLERFANLVAAAERERIIAANAPEIEKVNVYIKALEDAVAAEREACAKVCDSLSVDRGMIEDEVLKKGVLSGASMCALVIRERGAP